VQDKSYKTYHNQYDYDIDMRLYNNIADLSQYNIKPMNPPVAESLLNIKQ
jgi:hypothetical protein